MLSSVVAPRPDPCRVRRAAPPGTGGRAPGGPLGLLRRPVTAWGLPFRFAAARQPVVAAAARPPPVASR